VRGEFHPSPPYPPPPQLNRRLGRPHSQFGLFREEKVFLSLTGFDTWIVHFLAKSVVDNVLGLIIDPALCFGYASFEYRPQ